MIDRNETLVREAYEAYGRGDVAGMMEFVDPELEWTYLDPAYENPAHATDGALVSEGARLRNSAGGL